MTFRKRRLCIARRAPRAVLRLAFGAAIYATRFSLKAIGRRSDKEMCPGGGNSARVRARDPIR